MALPTSNTDQSVKHNAETRSSSQSQPLKRLSPDCAPSEAFGNNKTSMTGHTSSKEKSFVANSAPHVDILTRLAQARADLDKRYGKLSSQAQLSGATAGTKWTEVKPGVAPTESKSKTRLSRSARRDESKQGVTTPAATARQMPEEYVFFTTTGGGPPRQTLPQRPKVLAPASKQLHAKAIRDAFLSNGIGSVVGRASISSPVDTVPHSSLAKLDTRSVLVPGLAQSITHSSVESRNGHIEKDYQVFTLSGLHSQCTIAGTAEGLAALRGRSEAPQPRAARVRPLQSRQNCAHSRCSRSLSCPPRLYHPVHQFPQCSGYPSRGSQSSPAWSASDHKTHFNDKHLPAPPFRDNGYAPDVRVHGTVLGRPTYEDISRPRSAPPSPSPTFSTQLAHLPVRAGVSQYTSNTSLLTFKPPFQHQTHYCKQRIMAFQQYTQSDNGSGLFDTNFNAGFADNFDDPFNGTWDTLTDGNYAAFTGTVDDFQVTSAHLNGFSAHYDGVPNDFNANSAHFIGNSTHFIGNSTRFSGTSAQFNTANTQSNNHYPQTNGSIAQLNHNVAQTNATAVQHDNTHDHNHTLSDVFTDGWVNRYAASWLRQIEIESQAHDNEAPGHEPNNTSNDSKIANATPDNGIVLSSRDTAPPPFPPRNKIGTPVASIGQHVTRFNGALHPAQTPQLVDTFGADSNPQGTSQYAYSAQPLQAPSAQIPKIVNPPHVFRQHKFPAAQYAQACGTKRTHDGSDSDDVQITKHTKLMPETMSRTLSSESRHLTTANDISSAETPHAKVFSATLSSSIPTPITSPEQVESPRVPARLAAPPFTLKIETNKDSKTRGYRCTNDEIIPYITSWVRKEQELGVLKPASIIKISCNPGYDIGNRGEERRFWQIVAIVKNLTDKAKAQSNKASVSEEEVIQLSAAEKAEIEDAYKRAKRKQYREAAIARMTPEQKAAKAAKAKADREEKNAARKAEKEREAREAKERDDLDSLFMSAGEEEDDENEDLEFEDVATGDVPPQADEDADFAAQMHAAFDADESEESEYEG